MITVIETSTAERNEQTRDLFEKIRGLLDKGYSYHHALIIIGRVKHSSNYYQQGWFKELREYGKSQGYPYYKTTGKQWRR